MATKREMQRVLLANIGCMEEDLEVYRDQPKADKVWVDGMLMRLKLMAERVNDTKRDSVEPFNGYERIQK